MISPQRMRTVHLGDSRAPATASPRSRMPVVSFSATSGQEAMFYGVNLTNAKSDQVKHVGITPGFVSSHLQCASYIKDHKREISAVCPHMI